MTSPPSALLSLFIAASAVAAPSGSPPKPGATAASPLASLPAGRCTGKEGPPPRPPGGDEPFDLRVHPLSSDEIVVWERLGYRRDFSGDTLLDPKGTPVSASEAAFLREPWNGALESLEPSIWRALLRTFDNRIYRLDETTCLLMGPDSKPASRLVIRYVASTIEATRNTNGLERLLANLKSQDPHRPLPKSTRVIAEELGNAGAPLPAEIVALLKRPGATVGELRSRAVTSYEDLQAFFDNQTGIVRLPAASAGAAARRKPYLNSVEAKLGNTFRDAFVHELERNPEGRDLLARLMKQRNGLPNLLVLKQSQKPEESIVRASYSPDTDTMVLNHWTVVAALRAKLPPGQLALIEPFLSNPRALAKVLADNPQLLQSFVSQYDVEFYHELLHSEQSRRTRLNDEAIAGHVPPSNNLEKEIEAHSWHCQYLLSKASYDTAAVQSSKHRDSCLGMLRDPQKFRDDVTRHYQSAIAGSVTGDEFAIMQEVRVAAAHDLESRGWYSWAIQKLREPGMARGSEAISAARSDFQARMKKFDSELPEFRRAFARRMSDSLATENPPQALIFRSVDPEWISAPDAEALALSGVRWATTDKDPNRLEERVQVESLAAKWANSAKKSWPQGLRNASLRDFRAYAEQNLADAVLETNSSQRAVMLSTARAWAEQIGAADLLSNIDRAEKASK